MKLSDKGANLIAGFEGLLLVPYNDPAGYATVGVGHLLHKSRVTVADRAKYRGFTRKQAIALLQKDAGVAVAALKHVKVKLTQNQFDALVSLIFNIGTGAFLKSSVLRELNAGHYGKAADHFLDWDMAGGKHLPGLTHRRLAERKLFLNGKAITQRKPVRKVLPLAAGGWRAYVHGDTDCNKTLLVKLARVAIAHKTTIFVRSGKRTLAEQKALYAHYLRYGHPLAAVPGHSRHQFGRAADCGIGPAGRNIGDVISRAELKKYGLVLPVKGESWHVEEG